MSVKQKVLKLLKESGEKYLSGHAMAKELSVTRASIWKAIESLRKEGYDILGITNKGYYLEKSGDILTTSSIRKYIKTEGVFIVETRGLVTSTNTILRAEILKGVPEGYVLVAEAQTEGKGRQGKGFYSPGGHGAYFSVVLRPQIKAKEAGLITAAAAVATAQAVEKIFGVEVGIKWVNDLMINKKKICGILTEANFDIENNMVDSAVLGIGINVTRPIGGYPKEIAEIAGSITDRTIGVDSQRSRLIALALDNFWCYYNELTARKFLEEYKKRSVLLGQKVSVQIGGQEKTAYALAISDDCGLVVQYEDSEVETLTSGEVSIR